MSTLRHDQDRLVRVAFALVRSLEPTDQEVERALASHQVPTRAHARRPQARRRVPGRWRALPAVACAFALLGAGYGVAAPVRSAVNDVAGTFSAWLGGHSADVPGRVLTRADPAPGYMRDPNIEHQPRVIAENGGYRLFAAHERGEVVSFDLGNTGYGTAMALNAQFFSQHALFVLGPGAMQYEDRHGHIPLFGITALAVRSIVLTYRSGPPARIQKVRGAFVLLAEPARGPETVVALDAHDRVLARQRVDNSQHWGPRIDWQHYIRSAS